ncbi:uncharacterized protein [Haliotis asinina]|uniref:uncharacterized protein n=1 Tax=Haliotis asinina TaxID=109174 RepID=UPI00353259EA
MNYVYPQLSLDNVLSSSQRKIFVVIQYKSTSCKQLSRDVTETIVFRDEGCFLLSRVARTWEESKTFCETLGKGWSLVVIEDVETQRHVDNLTLTAKISSDAWIGLRRQDNKYRWVSGNNLGHPDFFRELGEGENCPRGHCVITSPPEDNYGTWNYADCTTKHFTICHTNSGSLHRRTTTAVQKTATSTTTSPTRSTTARRTTPAKTQTTATLAKEVISAPTSSSTRASKSSIQERPMRDSTARTSTKPGVLTCPVIVTDNNMSATTTAQRGICLSLISVVIVALVAALVMVVGVCIAWKCSANRALLNEDAGQQVQGGDVETYLRPCPEEHEVLE